MLGNIGPLEIIVVLIIALIVFGPKRLPELGNSLGKGIREFKDSVTGDHDDDEDDVKTISPTQATAPPPVQPPPVPVEKPAEPTVAPEPTAAPVDPEAVPDKHS